MDGTTAPGRPMPNDPHHRHARTPSQDTPPAHDHAHDHAHGHDHRHDHAHDHAQSPMPAPALRGHRWSALSSDAGGRLVRVGVALALLWLAVGWALAGVLS